MQALTSQNAGEKKEEELKHELHAIRILWKQDYLRKFKTSFSIALCLVEF